MLMAEVQSDRPVDPSAIGPFYELLQERMTVVPGVESVVPPGSRYSNSSPTSPRLSTLEGYAPRLGEEPQARYNSVSAGYFETVGLRLIEGRGFVNQDREDTPGVVVINESFARQYFTGQSPLGKSLTITAGPENLRRLRRIVGVVKDAKYNDLRKPIKPLFYAPITQLPRPIRSIEIRTAAAQDSAALAGQIRRLLQDLSPHLVVVDVRSVAQQVERPIARERLIAKLSALFGLLALGLACIGLYGLLSYSVLRRTAEIGVRLALGATSAQRALAGATRKPGAGRDRCRDRFAAGPGGNPPRIRLPLRLAGDRPADGRGGDCLVDRSGPAGRISPSPACCTAGPNGSVEARLKPDARDPERGPGSGHGSIRLQHAPDERSALQLHGTPPLFHVAAEPLFCHCLDSGGHWSVRSRSPTPSPSERVRLASAWRSGQADMKCSD